MTKPSAKNCTALVQHGGRNARVARHGRAPLLHLWIHEDGVGGKGIVLDVEQAEELIEGMNQILDQIEGLDIEVSVE